MLLRFKQVIQLRFTKKLKKAIKNAYRVFEGLVIRTDRKNSLASSITVRRISSGVGVEKSYLVHSPSIVKLEVVKRSKVRRNNLTYMRDRTGKSARLTSIDFDKKAVNATPVSKEIPAEEAVIDPKEL